MIKFAGVGAHHQNGIAKQAIHTISESTHTMLIHAAIHWNKETALNLWPFAVDYALHIWNHLPLDTSDMVPIKIIMGDCQSPNILKQHIMCLGAHPMFWT